MEHDLAPRKVISIANDSTLAFYLSMDVAAVELPKLFYKDKKFAPLILDGASGVGKTQQAFALLRSGKTLIYLNLSEFIDDTSQSIYHDMKKHGMIAAKIAVIDNAMANVEEFLGVVEDKLSLQALGRVYENFFGNDKLKDFELLIESLLKNQLIWRENELIKIQTECSADLKISDDVVLFIDEALPRTAFQSTGRGNAYNRLRFLRNLGRAMGMRIVLAGTAATAANMISEKYVGMPASRINGTENGWMQVIFWWQPIEETTFTRILSDELLLRVDCNNVPLLKKVIREERPLLAVLIQTVLRESEGTLTLMDVLEEVGSELITQKKTSPANHIIWLTGAWLDGEQKMPSPLRMRAPELVYSHFFEPAIAFSTEDREPLLVPLCCRVERASYPLRIGINTYFLDPKSYFSVRVQKGLEQLPDVVECGSLTEEFGDIEFGLTNCTQQCLSREPFLTIALSTMDIAPTQFHETISMYWQQTSAQRTVGELDGEIHEYIFFAAIQLASHKYMLSPCNVMEFIKALEPYIIKPRNRTSLKSSFVKKRLGFRINSGRTKAQPAFIWETELNALLCHEKMPWLVPAYSKKFSPECSALLKDHLVAGLVPGAVKARFDAYAYVIGSEPVARWVFEFRVRANKYELGTAAKDLEEKCESDAQSSHAMLIAMVANDCTKVKAWKSGTGSKYLRVVVLFAI